MARPGWPERNRAARSFRQLWRFDHVINSDKVFGTHRYECRGLGEAGAVRPWQFGAFPRSLSRPASSRPLTDLRRRGSLAAAPVVLQSIEQNSRTTAKCLGRDGSSCVEIEGASGRATNT